MNREQWTSGREQWIKHHLEQGHQPYAAPNCENPEQVECKCDPDAPWTAVWRILTPEQIRLKFAHLRKRDPNRVLTPEEARRKRAFDAHVAEIQAEQEERNKTMYRPSGPPLQLAVRYRSGRKKS